MSFVPNIRFLPFLLIAFLSFLPASRGTEHPPVEPETHMNQNTAFDWIRSSYLGEPTFSARSANKEWLAHVSTLRARLIYFGTCDEKNNLIRIPPSPVPPVAGSAPGWGGHVVWMLSDNIPAWKWPPNADWEFSAAETIDAQDGQLHLTLPHRDQSYPQLKRTYSWQGDELVCESRWSPNGNSRYLAIHTLHIPFSAGVEVLASRDGMTLLPLQGFEIMKTNPDNLPGLVINGETAIVAPAKKGGKYAFPTQTLIARIGGFQLEMARNSPLPDEAAPPFEGRLSHIWIASTNLESPFIEIEQASPFLDPSTDGECRFAIRLKARILQ